MRQLRILAVLFISILAITGCQEEELASGNMGNANPMEPNDNAPAREFVWADGHVFKTIVTSATFKPTSGNFDELYGGAAFKDGIGLISGSKPGDQDYNGGRWHLNVLKEGVDPSKYEDADSAEDLDPDDFMSTGNYFECPLLPRNW